MWMYWHLTSGVTSAPTFKRKLYSDTASTTNDAKRHTIILLQRHIFLFHEFSFYRRRKCVAAKMYLVILRNITANRIFPSYCGYDELSLHLICLLCITNQVWRFVHELWILDIFTLKCFCNIMVYNF